MTLRHLTTILLFTISLMVRGQNKDSVFYMNGNIVAAKVIDTLLGAVTFKDPADTNKKVHADDQAIFSVKYANGFTKYYYKQDTTVGNWFTREEMHYFMIGERDARKNYKSPRAFIGGLITGIGGGLTGVLYGPLIPGTYIGLNELTKIRIKQKWVSGPYLLSEDAYILGFQREAFAKRRIAVLKGSGIGLAVGFAAFGLYFNKGKWAWEK
ncbi:MAG: hypothetical protein ACK5AY_05280 [Bacteroidota bacterium]|jgi:hypothetical protein